MHHLGHTRSSYRRDHILHTPDTFVRAPLPGMTKATAIVHASPANGAGFTQYTAEFEAGGAYCSGSPQMFVYVWEGTLEVDSQGELAAGQYVYLPADSAAGLRSASGARAAIIEKPLLRLGAPPGPFQGSADAVAPKPLLGDEAVQVRSLIPDDPRFDFAVNIMTFEPGASLPMVEMHVMEHGLFMLEGEGIYRLSDCWYPVAAGDFIYMAPYCPQWFAAIGKQPAKYLIYKDWSRHPLHDRPH